MVSEGYKDAGYEYIIIDGCWHNNVKDNKTGELIPNLKRFPNGMKYVADYVSVPFLLLVKMWKIWLVKNILFALKKVHSKGLKFGLYHVVDANHIDYEKDLKPDARTFAKWGVDYMKFNFLSDAAKMVSVYQNFGKLLNETGRPMAYACSWPFYQRISRDTVR